ncbi:MAG: hypothetical protein KF833_03010 [Verrucomicrobiae bacterium]|nr:hypothetical protein [Verrucomicrobiae bacterium]
MGGDLDHSDFVDPDFQPGRRPAAPAVSAIGAPHSPRPPTREEIGHQVTATQQALAELKRRQEELERERTQLEEARRRRIEFEQGREEMMTHLTRGIGLLEESEQTVRREAEQLTRSLTDLRTAFEKVSAIREDSWSAEHYSTELARALATLENARMEWNSAQLKWPVLSGTPDAPGSHSSPLAADERARLVDGRSPAELARLGLALTWPVAVAILAVGILLALVMGRS